MQVNRNCYLCKGNGKVRNIHGLFHCPECEYLDLKGKAMEMRLDKVYTYTSEQQAEVKMLARIFRNGRSIEKWHIDILPNNRIRRIDWSWMD